MWKIDKRGKIATKLLSKRPPLARAEIVMKAPLVRHDPSARAMPYLSLAMMNGAQMMGIRTEIVVCDFSSFSNPIQPQTLDIIHTQAIFRFFMWLNNYSIKRTHYWRLRTQSKDHFIQLHDPSFIIILKYLFQLVEPLF